MEDLFQFYPKQEWPVIRNFQKESGRPFAKLKADMERGRIIFEIVYRSHRGVASMMAFSFKDQIQNTRQRFMFTSAKIDGKWKKVYRDKDVFPKEDLIFQENIGKILHRVKKPTLAQLKEAWASSQKEYKEWQAKQKGGK